MLGRHGRNNSNADEGRAGLGNARALEPEHPLGEALGWRSALGASRGGFFAVTTFMARGGAWETAARGAGRAKEKARAFYRHSPTS
jgi:hypothetical protein